jgi:hypothetical protein
MKNRYTVDGPVTYIEVTLRGEKTVTEIDTADLPIADSIPGTWFAFMDNGNAYVRANILENNGKRRLQSLHRLLMGNPQGLFVDHINRNTLDNKRSSNLRNLTPEQSVQNRGAHRRSKSGIRGVSWSKSHGKWQAQGALNWKVRSLGFYDTKEEAAAVVKAWRLQNMPYSYEGDENTCV